MQERCNILLFNLIIWKKQKQVLEVFYYFYRGLFKAFNINCIHQRKIYFDNNGKNYLRRIQKVINSHSVCITVMEFTRKKKVKFNFNFSWELFLWLGKGYFVVDLCRRRNEYHILFL